MKQGCHVVIGEVSVAGCTRDFQLTVPGAFSDGRASSHFGDILALLKTVQHGIYLHYVYMYAFSVVY